ncbi:hypothetical protein [Nonomuraea sp. NPDC050202]|jgi:hypothetical protein|uniref:hypothetical protein n=1 Tax=Nonomuraea sp. NPDC050202 TaxID=3155035 RepID=UPI0033FAC438
MSKLMGALTRLTTYAVAVAAAGLFLSAPSVAYADEAIPADTPSSPLVSETPADSVQSIHFGGM